MPRTDGLPPGTLAMLILRVLASQPLHGYAIAQRIARLSGDELSVEEGSLYPALQKLLIKGWVKASPTVSETGRPVREYRLTPSGRKQLEVERTNYRRMAQAIATVLDTA
jgi:transcriptional regulator